MRYLGPIWLLIIVCCAANSVAIAQSLADKTFKGEARSDRSQRTWPATLKITKFDERSGKFTGEITWHSLDAVHKVEGRLSGMTVVFKETEFIKKGSALLNVEYAFIYMNGKMTGRWADPAGDNGPSEFQ